MRYLKFLFVIFLFLLTSCSTQANGTTLQIAKEKSWPTPYFGDLIPIISGDISISIPSDISKITYDEIGTMFNFSDGSIINISKIDGNFYKSDINPAGITSKNNISVSFAGKIPFTYTSIKENIKDNDIDFWVWSYAIATRSIIFDGENIVNTFKSGNIEIFSYYSPTNKSPIVAEIHSGDESRYLLVSGSGVPIEKFFSILGTIKESK